MDLKLARWKLLRLFGSKLFNLDILEAHDVSVTTKSDMAFTALRSLMLRLGLIDVIEVGLHYNRAI